MTFNHAKLEPTVNGTTTAWELRDLPYIEDEPMGPPATNLAPRLAISYFTPGVTRAGPTFANWADVSRWLTELSDPQMTLDDNLAGDVDEMPDAVKMDAPFGSYETVYQVKDGQLIFTRKLVGRAATIPVEAYAKVRGFFGRIRAAEAAPVVLAKK